MKKLFVLAAAGLVASSAYAGEMKWSGSADWRYDQYKYNDSLSTTTTVGTSTNVDRSKQTKKDHAFRANLGVTGGWDNVEYGVDVRTNNSANNDFVNANEAADRTIGLDQAWFRYVHDFSVVDLSLTIGRQKNVFAYEMNSQNLFDNDVRFDGFGWNFKLGSFGLNAGQYVLGAMSQGANGGSTFTKTDATDAAAASQSHFNVLYGFQPYLNWKFTDEIDTMFAVAYYSWIDNSYTNTSGGGYNSSTLNATATAPFAQPVTNPKQWQFLNTWNLPYNLGLNAELVINNKVLYPSTTTQVNVDRSAWTVGLTYGKAKKAHDFSLGYAYGSKGLASVVNTFSYDRWLADNKGHKIDARYNLADNFHLSFEALFLKEKAAKQNTGLAYANANQLQKTNYWELDAGVNF